MSTSSTPKNRKSSSSSSKKLADHDFKREGLPLWLFLMVALWIWALTTIAVSPDNLRTFLAIGTGLGVTISVSIISYVASLILGLVLCLLRISRWKFVREAATFYIELVRGLPMLVILYYIAFVGAPFLADSLNFLLQPLIQAGWIKPFLVRNFDFGARAVLALTLSYAAFISEIFRAGIQSVSKGVIEAALSLGLSKSQLMLTIVLPQATRNVLPALANEFVAIIKDSALVSVLGVQDISQIAKVYSASTFKFFEAFNMLSIFYLILTVNLSLLVKRLENKLKIKR